MQAVLFFHDTKISGFSYKGLNIILVQKHDKKDFLVILVTLVVTFAFETSIGLAVGKEMKM